ncbi:hypothetical protein QM366_04265 [Streptococcus parasanguinis]|uniref:hypothetical protein n=1 Tax=Streptococcus parasanguinis TaxID=1318 RepID=UPI0039C3D31B
MVRFNMEIPIPHTIWKKKSDETLVRVILNARYDFDYSTMIIYKVIKNGQKYATSYDKFMNDFEMTEIKFSEIKTEVSGEHSKETICIKVY